MARKKKNISEKKAWREFEEMVARIERVFSPAGAIVKSPDEIAEVIGGKLREVDASIRFSAGSTEVLITIECRNRSRAQDKTWIEQLKAKKESIGASKTIAVSANGFSQEAMKYAKQIGMDVRTIKRVDESVINRWLITVNRFQYIYKEVVYHLIVDGTEDHRKQFEAQLKAIELASAGTELWLVPFLHSVNSTKLTSLSEIFEKGLMNSYLKLVDDLKAGRKDNIFHLTIDIPTGLLFLPNGPDPFILKQIYVQFEFTGYQEFPIQPSTNFQYSDQQEELIRGMEFKYENENGQKGIVTVHQRTRTGSTSFSFWPG